MLSRRTIFHLIVLVGSIFSTFPHVTSSSLSTAHRWKNLPGKGSKPPESNVMEIDDDVRPNPLIRQHDAVTSESEHVTDDVTAVGENDDKAEQLAKAEVAGEDERSWGKPGKRKWGQNSLSVWGKRGHNDRERRKWGDRDLSAWGKRSSDDAGVGEKRKWGENTMGVWGKRRSHEEDEEQENTSSADENPGTAASGHKPEVTRAGGSDVTGTRNRRKRSAFDHDPDPGSWYGSFDPSQWTVTSRRAYPRPNDGPKRKWETNTMKVWGKRNAVPPAWKEYPYHVEEMPGKRQWSSDSAIRIWGKRDSVHPKDKEISFGRFYDAYEN